jgi:serine protease Do
MEVLRDGQMKPLTVVLGRRETSEAAAFPAPDAAPATEEMVILGLTLSPITPELADQFSLTDETGLVITAIDPESPAASKGLLEGDLITEAGQQKVESVTDLQDRIDEATQAGRTSLLLLIRRGGDPRFVALGLTE